MTHGSMITSRFSGLSRPFVHAASVHAATDRHGRMRARGCTERVGRVKERAGVNRERNGVVRKRAGANAA